jgi:hypothetical protein
MNNFVKDMLLIEGTEAQGLYKELTSIATLFIGPMFITSLVIQFFGEYDFFKVIKKLLIISIMMTSFYTLHTKSVDISMEVANKTFRKVSPKNIFRKKWYRATLSKKTKKSGSTWELVKGFVTPALNDLIASSFFVTSSIFMSLLKYIYTSIYHLTYIFAGFSALLYFWGITEGALWGMVKSSLWCVLLPVVFISVLSLIGNTLELKAASGINIFSEIETIIWLFCVSLMLLMCPLITWKLVNSEGIAASAPQMGAISILAGSKALNNAPLIQSIYRQSKGGLKSAREKVGSYFGGREKTSNLAEKASDKSFSRSQQRDRRDYSRSNNSRSETKEYSSHSKLDSKDSNNQKSSNYFKSSDRATHRSNEKSILSKSKIENSGASEITRCRAYKVSSNKTNHAKRETRKSSSERSTRSVKREVKR